MRRNYKTFFYILYLPFFILEIFIYKLFRYKNTSIAFQAMIEYFCITGGWSNELIHKILKKKKLNKNIDEKIETYDLEKEGYLIKKNFLSLEDVLGFKKDLSKIDGYWFGDNYSSRVKEKKSDLIKSTKYYYNANDLLKLNSVQKILLNKKIKNIASTYLDAEPILYNINCWYSFPSLLPDSNAAQLWHFDMDRPKWLKLFFYISDCNENNGPHCYIKGTNRNNNIPFKIRKLGYLRIDDQIINNEYKKSDLIEFNFNQGDMIFEDTRGLHKGKQLKSGFRLMFQIEYTSCLFGNSMQEIQIEKNLCIEKFYDEVRKNPFTYQAFKII